MVMTKNEQQLLDVQSKLDKLCNGIDCVQVKQEEMSEDVAKIKEAVYNPDNGLYARLRELETWKSTSSKMIWTLFTSVIGLICAFILKATGP
jgi:peptidoglycan hydrolase CwlO-like protein